jgi:hypothetical protein
MCAAGTVVALVAGLVTLRSVRGGLRQPPESSCEMPEDRRHLLTAEAGGRTWRQHRDRPAEDLGFFGRVGSDTRLR